MKKLIIIGAGGHGKVVADIASKVGYEEIIFLEDNEYAEEEKAHSIVNKDDIIRKLNCDVAIGIGNAAIRQRIQECIEKYGANISTLIHSDAVIAKNVEIGKGTVIMAGVVINPGTIIGKGCIINTCSSIDHDCKIGDYVHVSVGSHLAGTVMVGDRTWIGTGATVSNNITITSDCMIGAGAVVVKSIKEMGTYVGVPANKIR